MSEFKELTEEENQHELTALQMQNDLLKHKMTKLVDRLNSQTEIITDYSVKIEEYRQFKDIYEQ